MPHPELTDYPEYYHRYVSLVPQSAEIIDYLKQQAIELAQLINFIPEERGEYAYAKGKWTIKEMISHIIDTERIFAYRALAFARKDTTLLPGFEQDDYVKYSYANNRSLKDLAEEFSYVRLSNTAMLQSFHPEVFAHKGTANNVIFNVNSIQYIMAGHVIHHTNILKERYL